MDDKTLLTLEFPKILERLAAYTAFTGSAEMARNLHPTYDIEEARQRLAETSEAVHLLVTHPDLTIGGVRDVRAPVDLSVRGGVLTPTDLLDIKSTLTAARQLTRTFERVRDYYPYLYAIVGQLPPPFGLVDAITHTISDRGEILDSASEKLTRIRHDLRVSHDRLLTKLQRMISDPKTVPYLQEALITQRDGRFVIPLRAEFKGRVRSVVHDQSSSGATLFVEPLPVVELNNQYRELQLAERDEERRILTELSEQVGSHANELLLTVEIISELDLTLARAKYSEDIHGTEPILHPFKIHRYAQPSKENPHPGSVIRLYQARHPLLDPQTVVPVDVELDEKTYAMIITGPNTGGKTVTLKTIGLLALMAYSGLHLPVHSGSEISIFHSIFADIGDEQSIEQSLSTFSSHVNNIIRILKQADRRSLVILDELGAGTDPQEGAALARAIMTHLLERGITTLVTTHHPELKAFAHATPGVVNASVEFDLETLQPTFHLTIGLPGRSNALAIAKRLGLWDTIIDMARAELNPQDLRAEDLLDEIYRQRDLARQARSAAEKARKEVESLRSELEKRLEKIEDERRVVLQKAQADAEDQVRELQGAIRELRRTMERTHQPLETLEQVEEQAQSLEETVIKPIERRVPLIGDRALHRPARLGDKVRLKSLNTQGVVTTIGEEEAEVQVGVLRVRARLSDLVPLSGEVEGEEQSPEEKRSAGRKNASTTQGQAPEDLLPVSPGMELDLRGQRADEALAALERYLDAAFIAGMPFARIIHGKGTGKLRQAIREALSQDPHIRSFEAGGDKEGGEGVTVVKFHPR